MGFGTELLFIVALGLVVLGPKRVRIVLAHMARAKAEFDKASRGIKFQLTFQLRVVDGLSIFETARILGVPHGTVKAQLARARAKHCGARLQLSC